jgi:hypothetical protein
MWVRIWDMMRVRIISLDIKSMWTPKVNSWLGWRKFTINSGVGRPARFFLHLPVARRLPPANRRGRRRRPTRGGQRSSVPTTSPAVQCSSALSSPTWRPKHRPRSSSPSLSPSSWSPKPPSAASHRRAQAPPRSSIQHLAIVDLPPQLSIRHHRYWFRPAAASSAASNVDSLSPISPMPRGGGGFDPKRAGESNVTRGYGHFCK